MVTSCLNDREEIDRREERAVGYLKSRTTKFLRFYRRKLWNFPTSRTIRSFCHVLIRTTSSLIVRGDETWIVKFKLIRFEKY